MHEPDGTHGEVVSMSDDRCASPDDVGPAAAAQGTPSYQHGHVDNELDAPRQTIQSHVHNHQERETPVLGRRQRIYAVREWVLTTFDLPRGATVLDVAGGRGDLSWLLRNVDGLNAVVIDPRPTNHQSLTKSVHWLSTHHDEAAKRAVVGSSSYQPLAALLPHLLPEEKRGVPRHLRVFLDDAFVSAVTQRPAVDEVWDVSWQAAVARADACQDILDTNRHHGDADPVPRAIPITNARDAHAVIHAAALVIGFHPDQATEACIDLALALRIPFAVCPCCVFPQEFPDRRLADGTVVTKYDQFIRYLCTKHPAIKVAELPFSGMHRHRNLDPALHHVSPAARSTVLYMLPSDLT
eukprot:m.53677 g.53677  ORF g.53677 m.53677 type:complete len:353 (-) comp7473_c0_seq1:1362-2420(-)